MSTPRFAVGAAVRVRPGTPDPDYPDIPLGGWAGVIGEVESDDVPEPIYLVQWTDETLAAAHPAYGRRCDRDDLEIEQTWVSESDLVTNEGGPLAMEQPTKLRPLPLDLEDPLDRARYLLGLTSDEDLPEVDEVSLRRFHDELSGRLMFPFTASDRYDDPVLVRRLLPPEEASSDNGLLAEVSRDSGEPMIVPLIEVKAPEGTVGRRDLEAYSEWLEDESVGPGVQVSIGRPLRRAAALVVLAASLVGAALMALDEAALAAQVGGVVLGLLGALLGSGAESLFRRVTRMPPGFLGGMTLGLLVGGLLGAAMGVLAISYVGAIPGAIAGTLLSRLWHGLRGTRGGAARPAIACAWVGGMAYVFLTDPWAAAWGSLRGFFSGAALCVVVLFGLRAYMAAILRGISLDE